MLFANSATLTSKMLDHAIRIIKKNPKADSIVSVSKYNMWSPLRARKVNSSGYLDPFVKFEYLEILTHLIATEMLREMFIMLICHFQ